MRGTVAEPVEAPPFDKLRRVSHRQFSLSSAILLQISIISKSGATRKVCLLPLAVPRHVLQVLVIGAGEGVAAGAAGFGDEKEKIVLGGI